MTRHLLILLILFTSSVALGSALGRAEASDDLCDQRLRYYTEPSTEPWWILGSVGGMRVVRFTPAESNVLVGARFYVAWDPMPFSVRIFDDRRVLLPYSWDVNPTSVGWVGLDINEHPKFNADFYIALEYTYEGTTTLPSGISVTHAGLPWLGAMKDNNVSGRSYYRYEDGTWEESEYSLMIEASMSGRYSLDIWSPVGGATGSGCYSEGAQANFSAPETVDLGLGKRAVFLQWNGDYQGSTPSGSIAITKPTRIEATYKVQYELKVTSERGNPQGSGWYDEGSAATFSVNSPLLLDGYMGLFGAKYVFDHWSGDSSASTPTASVTMDNPKTMKAEWKTDYTIPYVTIGATVAAIAIVAPFVMRRTRRKSQDETKVY